MLVGLSVVAEAGLADPEPEHRNSLGDVQRCRGEDGRRVGNGAGQFTMGMRFWVHGRVF